MYDVALFGQQLLVEAANVFGVVVGLRLPCVARVSKRRARQTDVLKVASITRLVMS
ncbi:hypothetical protein ACU4GD_14710 [Cupriavidus basilensis]